MKEAEKRLVWLPLLEQATRDPRTAKLSVSLPFLFDSLPNSQTRNMGVSR